MAHVVRVRTNGQNLNIVLRNPSEKAKRYASQLKGGKVYETGKKLSAVDRAYRAGYLDARSDNSKAFKSTRKRKTTTYTRKKR